MTYISSVERIGIEKGIEQGMQQGQARVLVRQLTHRFGAVPVSVRERLEKANIDELESWAEAVLSADSIESVFRAARH